MVFKIECARSRKNELDAIVVVQVFDDPRGLLDVLDFVDGDHSAGGKIQSKPAQSIRDTIEILGFEETLGADKGQVKIERIVRNLPDQPFQGSGLPHLARAGDNKNLPTAQLVLQDRPEIPFNDRR